MNKIQARDLKVRKNKEKTNVIHSERMMIGAYQRNRR